MRIVALTAVFCIVLGCAAAAQESANSALLKEFTRTGTIDGTSFSFVHLNDRTVDILFTAPGKYALRARANQSTLIYVQAIPDKDLKLGTRYSLEQDGHSYPGSTQNIRNFAGTAPKGERIDGLIQFEKKIDPNHEFDLKSGDTVIKFKLSAEALKLLQKPEPPKSE